VELPSEAGRHQVGLGAPILLSVVLPVYNRPTMVLRAIASASAQETGSAAIEIIVVDDGSTPPFTYNGQDTRVRVIRLPHNVGAAAARNAGISASRGIYVALLDSDDLWLPGKLARQLSMLRGSEGAQDAWKVVTAGAFFCPNHHSNKLELRCPIECSTLELFASGCWFNPGTTLLARKEAFDKVGPFDEFLNRLEDFDWFLRFGMLGGSLIVDPIPGAIVAPSGLVRCDVLRSVARRIRTKFDGTGRLALPLNSLRRLRAYLALEQTAAFLAEGRRVCAGAALIQSLLFHPRLRPALERFWKVEASVPAGISALYAEMMAGPM
jgi:glycosyltransferase involved in cell wall biosynthesis